MDSEEGNLIIMNSYNQWTDDNLTIDGFYAESDYEYATTLPGATQVTTTQEENLLNNSSSNTNMQRSRLQSPQDILYVFLPPNPNSSSASAPPRSLNAKQDFDEYRDFHFKCMGLRSSKGNNMMIANFRSVLHALAGIKVSSEHDQVNKEQLYRMMYSVVAAHLVNNCHKLIGNSYDVFAKIPDVKVPEFILPKLQLTFDNYSIE
jgi:DNA-binding Lrp family transcriptional regulator